jgi:cystathionine beta-lyase
VPQQPDLSSSWFDPVIDRRGTASLKWGKYRERNVIPLWVADMDFRSPPAVVEALKARVDHGVFGYTVTPAALVDTVLEMLAREYGWRVEAPWLVWLPGLVTGLNIACRATGEDGDGVLTTVPVYPPFLSAPGLSRRELATAPMARNGGRWELDFDQLERAVDRCSRLLLLCSPHNPTGRVFERSELTALAEFCERHNLILCSDEIHSGLVLDPGRVHIPTATLGPETARRTITLMAPSKTFNLPGLGCAFAVIPDTELRRRFRRVMAGIVPHVNALGYTAALAAYREGREWHRALLTYLRANRDLVAGAVAQMPGLTMTAVEATYLAWIDASGTGLEDPAGFFEEAGVGLSDGREFGAPGFLRFNFGCPRSLLAEALERMRFALDGRRRSP